MWRRSGRRRWSCVRPRRKRGGCSTRRARRRRTSSVRPRRCSGSTSSMWGDSGRCSSGSSPSSGRWTASTADDRRGAPRRPGADEARPRHRDHPRHRSRRAGGRGERGSADPLRADSRVPAVHRGKSRGAAARRFAVGEARGRDAGTVPSLRRVHSGADRLPGPRVAGVGGDDAGSVERVRRDASPVEPRRPDAHRGPHQPARRQPARRPERRPARPAVSGHVGTVRRGAARPGARRRAGARHHAARRRLRRRVGPEPGNARRVPHAARHRSGRGRDEHGAGGDHRPAHGHACAGRVDHHGPVPAGRAGAGVGGADHRGGPDGGAAAHGADPRRAGATQLMYPIFDPKLSVDALEKQLLATWKHERLFEKTREAMRYGPPFVFFEGPPTANGRPGIHHVFARTIKDLVCRYHTMLGQAVTRIAGWDTHGLPVEIEVDKTLGISGKKQIEAYGIEKFNKLCRESVFTYKTDWESLSERIAYWLDYEHPYITYTNEYIETVWWLLKRLHEKALLYRGHKVLPYCPRCGTALSSHELALGYDKVQTNSVYVTFPLASDPQRQLVIWTTTPWTLLANVAVAVHPELEYGEYEVNGARYIVAAARAGDVHVGGKPLATGTRVAGYRGRELVGQKYLRPLELVELPPEGQRAIVVAGGFVSADEGTGLVHMAPAFGADDYTAAQQYGLAFENPVGPDGTFQGTRWEAINGRLVTDKETNRLIIERLKHEGRWLETRPYEHQYPFCWRCDSALIYYARTSWFVRTTAVKGRMLEVNAQIGWHPPEVGSGRFGEWLENNVDWALSRDRYWGTPLNVWECATEAEHREVIGSYAELAERQGNPLPADFDPHKPQIDGYTWPCRQCGGAMRRVPEVIDAWFDSGAMPYAQWHYPFEHQADFKAHFPADFICEGVDQTRGWFYSLLAIGVAAFDSVVYKQVIVNELVLDAQGQKMSKSRGNVINPWQMVEQHGAEVVAAVRDAWNAYDVTAGTRAIMDFVADDLSNWYVRTNRPRFWAPDRAADEAALRTLYDVLLTTAQLIAPAAPFVSDWLHRALTGTSVHLASFPSDQGRREPELLAAMAAIRKLASLARAARETKQLPVRQPVAKLQVAVPPAVKGRAFAELLDVLKDEVNAKDVEVGTSDHELVNRVQRLRKDAGYQYTTRIELSIAGPEDVVAAVGTFKSYVEGETLARKTVLGAVLDEPDVTSEVDIEGRRVTIALRRHDGRKGGTR